MFMCRITHRFMHDIEVEMHNYEKLLENYRVCMNHGEIWNTLEIRYLYG